MKRLLLFLLLLGAGIAALFFAIGDERVTPANAADDRLAERPQQPPPGPAGSGIPLERRGGVAGTVTQDGPLHLPNTRIVPIDADRTRRELVSILRARHSRTTGSGQQELDGVELQMFDDGVHTSTLTAAKAFLALHTDPDGKASIAEGQDIDLRDVLLVTLPAHRLPGLRLQLATAMVRVEEDTVQLRTPRDEPVTLTVAGERNMTLRGLGVQALLPRSRTAKLRRADLEILQQPVLTSDGVEVRAKGRLHLVEDLDTGAGLLSLYDDVECDLTGGGLALPGGGRTVAMGASGAPTRVRGDQFVAWLLRRTTPTGARDGDGERAPGAVPGDGRERDDDRGAVVWRQLVLTGAPATIELPGEGGAKLSTPQVTVLPGLFGDVARLTAHGGASRFEQASPPRAAAPAGQRTGRAPASPLVGTSKRRVHVVLPQAELGAIHRSLGFPRWSLRPLDELQIGIVEGAAELHSAELDCAASDGVHLYGRRGGATQLVRGLGDVRIEQRATTPRGEDLVATGNDGFLMSHVGGRRLRLGPPLPVAPTDGGAWREHRFDVRYGDATVRGRGVGEIVERGVGEDGEDGAHTDVLFVSPDDSLVSVLPGDGLRLERVRRLQARLRERVPVALDAAGLPVEIVLTRDGDTVVARAPRMLQVGRNTLRLLPPDPERPQWWAALSPGDRSPVLRRTTAARPGNGPDDAGTGPQELELRGPRIDVHHAGERRALVDAVAVDGELPHLYARLVDAATNGVTTIACASERLRVLPSLVTPEAQRWLLGDGPLARLQLGAAAGAWLLLDDVRDFQLDDPRHGHVEGTGRRLVVTQAGRAALFGGDPATGAPADVTQTARGRSTRLRGARVRVRDDGETRLTALGTFAENSLFVPPTLTLHDTVRAGLLSHMQATCHGDIDVQRDAIAFRGPVVAQGLRPDGTLDPEGLAMDARQLHMRLDPAAQEIAFVTGHEVVVDWPRVRAQARTVELDVARHRLVASDPNEARATLANGTEILSTRIEIDYETLAVRHAGGHVRTGSVARKR